MYAVIDEGTQSQPSILDSMDAAVEAAATLARGGGKPKIFQEVGHVVLTPQLVAQDGHLLNGNGAAVVRKAATVGGRVKRSEDELSKLRQRILSWVISNEGHGAEAMSAGLHMSVKELTLPVRQLLAEKKIRKEGNARSTVYFVAKVATKKATKKGE